MELLDVLQQLEEQNANESHIDLDSSLAPLSQQHNNCKKQYQNIEINDFKHVTF